jgi:NTE family protein
MFPKTFSVICLVLLILAPGPHAVHAQSRPSVALVLAGGGARGYAHIPVLELIEELDIPVDMIIGTSAGAIVGGLYCAGYSPQMLYELLFDLDWNAIFLDHPVFPFERQLGGHSLEANPLNLKFSSKFTLNLGKGFSTGQEAYKLLRSLTAKIPSYTNFDTLPVPFRATGVGLTSGKLELFAEGDLAEAIRASMSIPAVFEPFNIEGKYYLDGGVLSNLPVDQAKAMGYDIIIAVDLLDEIASDAHTLESSPLMALYQTLAIYSHSKQESQHSLADAVLIPDVARYTIIDFPKAREIYAQSKSQVESFRQALLEVREKIYNSGPAAPIPKGDRYAKLSDITTRGLTMSGELPGDQAYIRLQYERLLEGRPVTRDSLAAFIDTIYKTGSYNFVIARIDARTGRPLLELRLLHTDPRSAYLVFGAGFQQTISSDALIKWMITIDAQFRGLTGPGSVLALGTSPLAQSFRSLFFQPLNQRLYFLARLEAVQDTDRITSGFTWRGQAGGSMVIAEIRAGLGYKIDESNTAAFDAFWFAGAYLEGVTDYFSFTNAAHSDINAQTLGLSLNWQRDTLDFPVFPRRGVYLKLENTAAFPLGLGKFLFTDTVSADFTAVLPAAGHVSLALNAFAGAEITGNLRESPALTMLRGFNTADRLFFPQISGRQRYGAMKGAASAVVQFQPFTGAKILGVDWFLGLSGSAGAIADGFDALYRDQVYWNALFNTGVRFTPSFGAVLRIGAGKGAHEGITPVIALDLGSLRF